MDRKRRLMENNNGWPLRSQLFDGAPFRLPLTHTAVPASAATGTTATFTRATAKTWANNDGYLVTGLAGEIGFPGARRIRNLVQSNSENLTLCAAAGLSANATVTATTLALTSANASYWYSTIAIAAQSWSGRAMRVSAYVTSTVDQTVCFRLTGDASGVGATISNTALLAGVEQRVSLISTTFDTTVQRTIFGIENRGAVGATNTTAISTLTFTRVQFEDVTAQTTQTAGEYVSVGVASAPYYHGSFVDGVRAFPIDLSGNSIPSTTLLGYKPELAATNVLFKSNTLNDGTWSTSGTPTPTQDAIGVDGATSAWTLTDNNAAATELILQNKTLTAATWTGSVFVDKTSGAQASYPIFSVQTGSSTTGMAQVTIDTTNGIATPWTAYTGWTGVSCTAVCENYNATKWRVSVTFTGTAAAWYSVLIPAGTTNPTQSTGIYDVTAQGSAVFERAQLELGSAATSYIDNTSAVAAVTRDKDQLTYSGGDIPNLKTLCATFKRESGVSGVGVIAVLTAGTDANTAAAYLSSATASAFAGVVASVTQWSQATSNAYTPGTTSKMAWSQATNDIKMAKDGTAQTQDTVATVPSSTALQVGHQNGAFQLSGNVGGIHGWTRNLSQSELNAITAL